MFNNLLVCSIKKATDFPVAFMLLGISLMLIRFSSSIVRVPVVFGITIVQIFER